MANASLKMDKEPLGAQDASGGYQLSAVDAPVVPPGYKLTEVGVIPEDWEVKSLGSVLHRGRLGGNYQNQDAETSKPLMKMGNISRGSMELEKVQYVPGNITPGPEHRLQAGDVLFNTRNTLDLVGKVAMWRDELPVAYYNSNLMRLEFNPDEICSNAYANYALNSTSSIARLRGIATGTTSVAAIYTRDLLQLPLLIPKKTEQRAIATALSDVDALVAKLDALIAKKRDLKQAAMQQLLTGQTRLPGFSGEWKVKRLRDAADVVMGQSPAGTSYNRIGIGSPLINGPTEFTDKHPIKIQWTSEPTKFCQKGDLLLCVRGSSTGRINSADDEYCIGRGVAAIRAKPDADTSFITYQVHSAIPSILAATTGSTFPNIDGKSIRTIAIPLPSPDEQIAIASILYDMDAEIAALEARRDKTRLLKHGMMQELLTGRIRLV